MNNWPPKVLSVEESAALDTVIQLKRIADALEALLAGTPGKGTAKQGKRREDGSTDATRVSGDDT
jgi:hypothetical protein